MDETETAIRLHLHGRYTHHRPHGNQVQRYTGIRDAAYDLARLLAVACPDSPELEQAMNRLDEVVMWANAAIARNEPEVEA
jgi:hypothetical protein